MDPDYIIGCARATQLLSPDNAGATEMLEGTKSHILGQRSLIGRNTWGYEKEEGREPTTVSQITFY